MILTSRRAPLQGGRAHCGSCSHSAETEEPAVTSHLGPSLSLSLPHAHQTVTPYTPTLQDDYPGVFRFSAPVFPSEEDHVVTAPYNALLAAHQLTMNADCVLPVENQALLDICNRIDRSAPSRSASRGGAGSGGSGGDAAPGADGAGGGGASGNKPWDAMNGVAASMLLHLTAGVRFEGSLNVDLNDITMNLVPFPRMHLVLSSLVPLVAPRDVGRMAAPRSMDQVGAGGVGGVGGGEGRGGQGVGGA